ncbi:MAG: response regulator [Bryobacteraceae bacterium]
MALCVLLVEDNPADVLLVREALEEHFVKAEVFVVNDGQKAIDFIDDADAGTGPRPQFVILDLNLPKKSGHEVLRHIRGTRTLADLRVIVLSSSDAPRDREAMAGLGLVQYIRKPSSLEDLAAVGVLLERLLAGSH